MTTVAGSVALVTGAGGGIGRALADRLAERGAVVVTTDLPGRGGHRDLDVRDGPAVREVLAGVVAEHGRLDVVAHVAGIAVGGLLEDLTDDDWQRAVDVNLWGAVNVVRAAHPLLVGQGGGHLLVVASLAGLVSAPLLAPYAASKAAVVALAGSARVEGRRHGIRVTTVCPGPVDTRMLDDGGADGTIHDIDARRFLERAIGRSISPASLAAASVRAVERNRSFVVPGRGGLAWRAARLSPWLADRAIGRAMAAELRATGRSGS